MGEFDQELFKGKTLSSLFKDIYKNSREKENQIKTLIVQLSDMVSTPGDALIIVPLIQGYLEVAVKNDEALIKIANIVQRAVTTKGTVDNELLSAKDMEQIFQQVEVIKLEQKTANA